MAAVADSCVGRNSDTLSLHTVKLYFTQNTGRKRSIKYVHHRCPRFTASLFPMYTIDAVTAQILYFNHTNINVKGLWRILKSETLIVLFALLAHHPHLLQ